MPVTDASFQFETVLDDLQRDAWPVPSDQRVARCTGAALQVRALCRRISLSVTEVHHASHVWIRHVRLNKRSERGER